jgi:hypothetical protein
VSLKNNPVFSLSAGRRYDLPWNADAPTTAFLLIFMAPLIINGLPAGVRNTFNFF